jgi:hypothetical protein
MSFISFLFSFLFLAFVLFDFKKKYVPQVKNYPYVSGAVIIWIALTFALIATKLSLLLIFGYAAYQAWSTKTT